jgi:hypothetical protein
MILDNVADRDAVMALSAMTASPLRPSSIASAVRRIDAAPRLARVRQARRLGELVERLVEHFDFSDYRRSNSRRHRNMKRATLNTEENT